MVVVQEVEQLYVVTFLLMAEEVVVVTALQALKALDYLVAVLGHQVLQVVFG